MAGIQATALRRGTTILYENSPYKVLEFEHRTPARQRGFVDTKLRNLVDGTQRKVKFWAAETLERAHVEAREMDYLYSDGSAFVFMDIESYDQIELPNDLVGETAAWLSEGMRLSVELLDTTPIGLKLPKTLEATVRETEAHIKGQTAARSTKPAVLENGIRVQVPTFIGSGDRIRVDPADASYVERVK
ncbi:MAG: elongation factor P [Deltaproteobacteria bacterium]|nr:elongation factor P [Deltaproteobacteria bacterium]